MVSAGYVDAATALTRECNLGLDKWEVADNIDLYYVVQDFEEYFEIKFQKKPVLVRKATGEADPKKGRGSVNLPKIGSNSKENNKLPPTPSEAKKTVAAMKPGGLRK